MRIANSKRIAGLGSLALVATLVVTWWSGPPRRREGTPDLVVATYNLNFGLAGDPETLDALRELHADVLMLQETTPEWELFIRAALSTRYPHMHFVGSDWPAGGSAILSRRPLRDVRVSASAIGWFPALAAIVETPAGPVQLLDVHLKPPVSQSGSLVAGYFSTPPERAREMRAHLEVLDPSLPWLIVGDFNEERGGGLGVLEARGMETTDELSSNASTWRWRVGPITLRQRLDHVTYDPTRFECLRAEVRDRGRSDHLAVIAELRLRG